jgi:hypothetical protein
MRSLDGEVAVTVEGKHMMGDTFMALSGFWVIMSEIFHLYRGPKAPRYITLAFALSKYEKLLRWTGKLPESMVRGKDTLAHVFIFQFVYVHYP